MAYPASTERTTAKACVQRADQWGPFVGNRGEHFEGQRVATLESYCSLIGCMDLHGCTKGQKRGHYNKILAP